MFHRRPFVDGGRLSGAPGPAAGSGTMALTRPELIAAGGRAERATEQANLRTREWNALHAQQIQLAAVTPLSHARDLVVTRSVERATSLVVFLIEFPVGLVTGNEIAGGIKSAWWWSDPVRFLLAFATIVGSAALFGAVSWFTAHSVGHVGGAWLARRAGRTLEVAARGVEPPRSAERRLSGELVLRAVSALTGLVVVTVYVGNLVRGSLLSTDASPVDPVQMTALVMGVPMLAAVVLMFRYAYPAAVRLEQLDRRKAHLAPRLRRDRSRAGEERKRFVLEVNASLATMVLTDRNQPSGIVGEPPLVATGSERITVLLEGARIHGAVIELGLSPLEPLDDRPVRFFDGHLADIASRPPAPVLRLRKEVG